MKWPRSKYFRVAPPKGDKMKLLNLGDLHTTNKTPKRRTDNFFESFDQKLTFILDTAKDEGVDAILQPGDFFDNYNASDYLLQYMISKYKEYKIPIITIYGQHDLRFHSSNKENTPLAVLEASGVVSIAGYIRSIISNHNVHIYGCSWGEDIPVPKDTDAFNILLIHKMIIKDEKLWFGQEDYTMSRSMLKGSLWDLVISGDNHQSFVQTLGDKTLINCGSLMRSTIAQKDHKPVCYIFDVDTRSMKEIFIPCKPFSEVFNEDKIEEEKVRNKVLEQFVDSLQNDISFTGLDFSRNLEEYLSSNKGIDEGTFSIINELLGRNDNGGEHNQRVRRSR